MSRHCITLVSFGPFERSVLERTAQTVGAGFRCLVTVREGHLDLGDFYDPARRQYNGNLLLKTMDDLFPLEGCKSIGLFNVDLFIPILTFIFGQAYLGGKSGIASMYRLSNERYGMTPEGVMKSYEERGGLEDMKFSILERKVYDNLIANSKITEVDTMEENKDDAGSDRS